MYGFALLVSAFFSFLAMATSHSPTTGFFAVALASLSTTTACFLLSQRLAMRGKREESLFVGFVSIPLIFLIASIFGDMF